MNCGGSVYKMKDQKMEFTVLLPDPVGPIKLTAYVSSQLAQIKMGTHRTILSPWEILSYTLKVSSRDSISP